MDSKMKLEILCGICWIITYILIIIKSFKNKTCGMPFPALSLNLAWEFIFSFVYIPLHYPLARIIFTIWFLLDCIVLYTYIRYGYKDFKKKYSLNKIYFSIYILSSIIFSVVFMYLYPKDIAPLYNNDILQAAGFIANGQNLLMSILFVFMILERKNLNGQSIFIAIFKWLGTFSVSILKFSGILIATPTELFIILLIQIFDILYIYLIYKYTMLSAYNRY